MKIAFISPYPPSKVSLNEYGYHLIRSFVGKKEVKEIYVLSNELEDNSSYEKYKIEGVEIIPCWKFDSFRAVIGIRKQLKKLKPDLVIMNLQFMSFGENKIAAALGLLTPYVCKKLKIPSIVILHNITETVDLSSIGMARKKWKKKLFGKIGRVLTKMILKADVVGVTIAKYVKILSEKYNASNVVLLPHGNFELPERKETKKNSSEINLMAFGKFGTYKKVEVLIEAMKILEGKYPDKKFETTIAGSDNPNVKGYLDSVRKKYNELSNLCFTGYVAEEEVEDIFVKSSYVVFPYTTTTGSSGILHQAGSYAKACILPKIDDLESLVDEEGYCGSYFEPNDPNSLALAISKLIDDPDKKKEIEEKNYLAAKGLPMSELAEWYLSHAHNVLNH